MHDVREKMDVEVWDVACETGDFREGLFLDSADDAVGVVDEVVSKLDVDVDCGVRVWVFAEEAAEDADEAVDEVDAWFIDDDFEVCGELEEPGDVGWSECGGVACFGDANDGKHDFFGVGVFCEEREKEGCVLEVLVEVKNTERRAGDVRVENEVCAAVVVVFGEFVCEEVIVFSAGIWRLDAESAEGGSLERSGEEGLVDRDVGASERLQ